MRPLDLAFLLYKHSTPVTISNKRLNRVHIENWLVKISAKYVLSYVIYVIHIFAILKILAKVLFDNFRYSCFFNNNNGKFNLIILQIRLNN